MEHDGSQRPVRRVETHRQERLFAEAAEQAPRPETKRMTVVRFENPNPRDIRVGVRRLDEHLQSMGLRDALVLRELLSKEDWSRFEARYSAEGRPGYAPWLVAGVVLFGLMRGVSSLRELERLARSDLECMWISGGITPDHSALGRFITRHDEELSGEFFDQVTRTVLLRTGSGRERLAGDGTVLEAMSSRAALLKREAAEAQREETRKAAQASPQDAQAQAAHEQAERICEVLEERPTAKAVVPGEPEAGLLKQKNGRGSRPGFQAAVMANEARVVTDAEVHSTSELAAVEAMIGRLDAEETREVLLDAAFNTHDVLERAVEKDLSLMCPEQARRGQNDLIPTREFRYVADGDYYRCPAGERLVPWRRRAGAPQRGVRAHVIYATPACGGCAQRSRCTRAAQRRIQRAEGEELKEAMREVMAQSPVKRIFAQRKAMVEPVFSHLRERHRLNRFRRRGLAGVRLEFRLHVTAYNLGRALAYARRGRRAGFSALREALASLTGAIERVAARVWSDLMRTQEIYVRRMAGAPI